KKKISESHKGKIPSEETRKIWSEQRKGRPCKEETKIKMSKNHCSKKEGFVDPKIGIPQTPETIQKRVEARKGYRHTKETIKRITESQRLYTDEERKLRSKEHCKNYYHKNK